VRHWLHLHLLYTMNQGLLFHNVTYSVHDEFLMTHQAQLVVLMVPHGRLVSSTVALQINCLYCSPLGGPGSPSAPLPMVTPFPSGSTHSLNSPSSTLSSTKQPYSPLLVPALLASPMYSQLLFYPLLINPTLPAPVPSTANKSYSQLLFHPQPINSSPSSCSILC
jgi:hypothetical protein